MQKMRGLKNCISALLENVVFERLIEILIILNLAVFILDTDAAFHGRFSGFVAAFEFVTVMIFSAEYILRVCLIKSFKDIFKPMMVIDFLAIAPYYLSFVAINTVFLRALRFVRLLRLAKLARYTKALENIKQSFLRKKYELLVTGCIFIIGLTVSAFLIYFAENQTGVATFQSIPRAFWWSIVTFTSVGYGDTYPITSAGKVIASFSAIMGVGLHGLFIGIVGSAFIEGIEKDKAAKKACEERVVS